MSVTSDIQNLDPGAIVELFVLDATSLGGAVNYFHAGTNGMRTSVIWQGNTYQPWPVLAKGFDKSSQGQLPRPTLQMANVAGTIGSMAAAYGDLLGAKVTRKRTFVRYLDGANWPDGRNATADPNAAFPDDLFYVDQKSSENKSIIEFTLAAQFDLAGVKLPLRVVVQTCQWQYKREGCGYVPGSMFDLNDNSTTDASKDQCGKRLSSCKLRFGANAVLPFGGFPGAGTIR